MNSKESKYIRESSVQFQDFVMIENHVWYASCGFNGLFCADLNDRISKFIGYFPNEVIESSYDLFGGVCKYSDNLVFAPYRAENIAVYDITANEFKTYKIPEFEQDGQHGFECKFRGLTVYDDDIFFLGVMYPVIMQFNITTGKIKLHFKWYDVFKKYGECSQTYMFDQHILRQGDCFIVSSRQNNVLMRYNMKNNQAEFIPIGSKDAKYGALAYGAGYYWLIHTFQNELFRYSYESGKSEKVLQLPGEPGNFDIVFCNRCIWMFSKRFQKDILAYDMVYNIDTGQLEIINLKKTHKGHGVVFAKEINENVYCMYPDKNCFYKLCYIDGELHTEKISFLYEDDAYAAAFNSRKQGGVFIEKYEELQQNTHRLIPINDLENFLLNSGYKKKSNRETCTGKKIWQCIKGELERYE